MHARTRMYRYIFFPLVQQKSELKKNENRYELKELLWLSDSICSHLAVTHLIHLKNEKQKFQNSTCLSDNPSVLNMKFLLTLIVLLRCMDCSSI